MAKIPTILEAGRADGKLIKTNSIYDDNQEKFLSDKIKEIDDNHNELTDTVNSLTDTVNNNKSNIETKLVQEKLRASNAENNLRETISNITEINENATSANIVTVDTIPNTSFSNVQQALNELFKNALYAGIATPTTNPGTPDSPIFYFATEAGTYSNFGGIKVAEGKAVILQWNDGTWTKKTTGLATEQEIIYDVSARNSGVVFESLQALLSSSNLSTLIPTLVRRGGMSIRFIQGSASNSNNKYVQYRLMSTAWSTNVSNWQGVDDEPTVGSDNLVKSGGVKEELRKKVNVINDSESKLTDNSDGFYFADQAGNVIAKITKDGLQSIKFLDKDGEELDETVNKIKEEFALNKTDVDDRLTEIEKTKVPINNNYSVTNVSDNSDGFYFTDKNGNIIAKILSDGIHTIALYDKDGNEVGSADASIENIKDKVKQDGFYFTDFVGNVIAKINKDGLQAIKFLDKDGYEIVSEGIEGENGTLPIILNNNLTPSSRKVHPLYGKDIYSFGDSLCKGTWEKMLADITGANFNKAANDLTSWGGSFTGDEGGPLYNEEGYGQNGDRPGGLRRAKNFVLMPKETYGNKDVIFFENVHDGVLESENISAKPFMWTRYAIYEGQEFYDTNVAGRYFEENRSSILQSVGFTTPQVGTMVKMKVKAVTVPLVFSNGATNSGSVKISINGKDFETEVTEGDSIEQVIDKISVWSFSDTTGWKNKKLNSTTINLQYVGGNNSSEDDVITFDGQGTGVVATINSKTETVAYRTHAFLSLDINEWNNSEAWSYYAQHTRCYSNWKGVIEYIQKKCPETKMYMLLFPNSVYSKSCVRADGSFDVEAFYASTPWQQHINNRRCLINVADYYNIPIIDLEKEMNVMCNWETYFPENNVHMKTNLYQRFAEIIASKIY